MKKLLLGIFILSSQLFAVECPPISGSFTCQQGSHVSYKIITQTNDGYLINSDGIDFNYITDGKTYEVEATSNMKDGKVTSTCTSNKFIVGFKATILYEGSELAKQSSVTEYTPVGSGLMIVQKTKMKGIPLPAIKFNCTRD